MIHETTTPNGLTITFEDGEPDPETGKSKRRSYLIDGEKFDSVTTVLGVLDKPGLKYGAEKATMAGAIELARNGGLPQDLDRAIGRLQSEGLRFWQVWGGKARRGTVSHEDLVRLTLGQEIFDLDTFPEDQQAFIRGVSGWVADERPEILEAEVMVASKPLRVAGRHDLFGRLPRRHPTAKFLIDLKTTDKLPRYKSGEVKPPYPEHLLQLGAYELLRRASGYEPSDYQAVLRVDAAGAHDLFVTVADPAAFVAVLECYRALKGVPTKPEAVLA